MLRVFWDAVRELDAEAPDEGQVMRWCSPAELETLWHDAGLRDVEVDELVVSAGYESFDDYWLPFTSGIGPSGSYCAGLPPSRRGGVERGVLSPARESGGPVRALGGSLARRRPGHLKTGERPVGRSPAARESPPTVS